MKIHPDKTQNRLISFELQAISELFHHWSIKSQATGKISDYKVRAENFRKAILGIKLAMQRETIPHEITADEYILCHEAIKQSRKKCGKQTMTTTWLEKYIVEYEVVRKDGKTIQIYGPFPAPPIAIENGKAYDYCKHLVTAIPKRYSKTAPLKELVFEVLGKRFGMAEGTVADHIVAENRYGKVTPKAQALLAMIFNELNFYKDSKTQGKILDCLLYSGYSLFKLYYLIQISHSIDWQMSLGPWKQGEIDKLCEIIYPDYQEGAFTKLLQA